jgi:hypothetical protein
MNKPLKIALVLGLLQAFQLHAREYPPLPVAPNRPPVDAPGIPARPVVAVWEVTAGTRDVLEMSDRPDAAVWMDLPGPYEVREVDGVSSYWVRVPIGYAKSFFRVRRDWGNPWVF